MDNEKFNRKAQCHAKREDEVRNLEKAIGARSVKVETSMGLKPGLKAKQDPDSSPAALTTGETIARRSGGGVEDLSDSSTNYGDSSSDNSSSSASSRLSSAASRHSLVYTSDKDSESANNGQRSGRKSRKWFRLKNDKVVPL